MALSLPLSHAPVPSHWNYGYASVWTEASYLCYGLLLSSHKEQTTSIYNRCLDCEYITPNLRRSLRKLRTLIPCLRHSRNTTGIESRPVLAEAEGEREDLQEVERRILGRCVNNDRAHMVAFVKVQNDIKGQILLYINFNEYFLSKLYVDIIMLYNNF